MCFKESESPWWLCEMATQVSKLSSLPGTVATVGDKESSKRYLYSTEIPHLFECLMSGLIHHQPTNHISFLRNCLAAVKQSGGVDVLRWDSFIETDQTLSVSRVTPQPQFGSKPSSARKASGKPKTSTAATSTVKAELAPLSRRLVDTGRKSDLSQSASLVLAYVGPILSRGIYELAKLPKTADVVEASSPGIADIGDMEDEKLREEILSKLFRHQGNHPILLVNYPRNATQLQWLLTRVGGISTALFIDYSEENLRSRLALSTDRALSTPAAINTAIESYKYTTLPVVHWLDMAGKLKMIDGKCGEEEVISQISQVLGKYFKEDNSRPADTPAIKAVEIEPISDPYPDFPDDNSQLHLLFVGPVANYNFFNMFLTGKARHVIECGNAVEKLPQLLSQNERPIVCFNFPANRSQFDWFLANISSKIDKVVVIDCAESTLRSRMAAAEMTPSAIEEAITTYKQHVVPIIHWFDRAGKANIVDGETDDTTLIKSVTALFSS